MSGLPNGIFQLDVRWTLAPVAMLLAFLALAYAARRHWQRGESTPDAL